MSMKAERDVAIEKMVETVKSHLAEGVDVDSINHAKQELVDLCSQTHLFPRSDFPIPDKEIIERFFLVFQDENDEYALYINSALPSQTYRPHSHGGSWAIIAAVEGNERHGLYRETSADTVELINEIVVQPGTAVSMLEDGIHSIAAEGDDPLLHLHFYGTAFNRQGLRKEYDLDTGLSEAMFMEDLDFIEDVR